MADVEGRVVHCLEVLPHVVCLRGRVGVHKIELNIRSCDGGQNGGIGDVGSASAKPGELAGLRSGWDGRSGGIRPAHIITIEVVRHRAAGLVGLAAQVKPETIAERSERLSGLARPWLHGLVLAG